MIPHQFPFRLADRRESGNGKASVIVRLAGDSFWGRDGIVTPLTLAIEIVAQAVAIAESDDSGGGEADRQEGAASELRLAGIDAARLHRALLPGESFTVERRLVGSFGPLSKVVGRLIDEQGECAVEATLLLAKAV